MLIAIISICVCIFLMIILFSLAFENSYLKQQIENQDDFIERLNDEIAQLKKEIIEIYSEKF